MAGFLSDIGRIFRGIGQNVPMAQAALAGDYGAMASMRSRQQQMAAAQAEAEREEQLRQAQMAAAGELGFSKSEVLATNANDLSAAARDRMQMRQFGAEGGSLYDPRTQQFTRAPAQRQVGRTVVDFPANGGAPEAVFRGVEPVVVPEVGVFGWDDRGPVNSAARQQQPQPGQQPQNIPSGNPLDPNLGRQPSAPGNGASFRDPVYDQLEAGLEQEYGLPQGLMSAIRTRGERSNANQVSEAGARSVYQIIPDTARLFQQRYGVNAYSGNPADAARVAALHLRESLERHGDPNRAVLEYHGGTDTRNWGPRTRAYAERVGSFEGGGPMLAQGSAPNMPGQQQTASDAQPMIPTGRRPPPGYQYGPGGTLQAIPGGPGDNSYDRGRQSQQDMRQQQQDAGQVLQQFRSDQTVQQWRQARTSAMQLRTLGQSGRPADDLAIIFQFMKTLDPSSTVREGEVASVQNTAGVPERIIQYYNQARTGNSLTPQMRMDLVRTAERLYTDRSRVYNEQVESFRQQALAMGIPPARVGQMFPLANAPRTADRQREEQQQRRQQEQQARNMGRTPSGVRFRIIGQ